MTVAKKGTCGPGLSFAICENLNDWAELPKDKTFCISEVVKRRFRQLEGKPELQYLIRSVRQQLSNDPPAKRKGNTGYWAPATLEGRIDDELKERLELSNKIKSHLLSLPETEASPICSSRLISFIKKEVGCRNNAALIEIENALANGLEHNAAQEVRLAPKHARLKTVLAVWGAVGNEYQELTGLINQQEEHYHQSEHVFVPEKNEVIESEESDCTLNLSESALNGAVVVEISQSAAAPQPVVMPKQKSTPTLETREQPRQKERGRIHRWIKAHPRASKISRYLAAALVVGLLFPPVLARMKGATLQDALEIYHNKGASQAISVLYSIGIEDNEKAKSDIGFMYFQKGDFGKSRKFAEDLKLSNNVASRARGFLLSATVAIFGDNDIKRAIADLTYAGSLYSKLSNDEIAANGKRAVDQLWGNVHWRSGDLDSAAEFMKKSGEDGLGPLANIEAERGNFDKAIKIGTALTGSGEIAERAAAHNVLSYTYFLKGDRELSRTHAQLALEVATLADDKIEVSFAKINELAYASDSRAIEIENEVTTTNTDPIMLRRLVKVTKLRAGRGVVRLPI